MGFKVRIQFLQKYSFERNSNDYRGLCFNSSRVLHGFYKKVNHPISSAHKKNVMNDQTRQDAQYPKREQLHEGKCFVFGIVILIGHSRNTITYHNGLCLSPQNFA